MALKKMWMSLFGLLWLFLANACVLSQESSQSSAKSANTALTEENRLKWKRLAAHDYSFSLFQGCFCVPQGWSRVEVRAGKVLRLDSIPGLEGRIGPFDAGLAPTIDELFAIIDRAGKDSNFAVEAEYDSAYGYPSSIRIAYVGKPHLYDAGFHAEVKELGIVLIPDPPKPD